MISARAQEGESTARTRCREGEKEEKQNQKQPRALQFLPYWQGSIPRKSRSMTTDDHRWFSLIIISLCPIPRWLQLCLGNKGLYGPSRHLGEHAETVSEGNAGNEMGLSKTSHKRSLGRNAPRHPPNAHCPVLCTAKLTGQSITCFPAMRCFALLKYVEHLSLFSLVG